MTEQRKVTHKPVGVYNLLVVAFLAIFAIVLIGFGIRDIRNGEGAGFWFFVGWLALIAAVVFGGSIRKKDAVTPKPPSDPIDKRPPSSYLLLPFAFQQPDGPTPMLEGDLAKVVFAVFIVVLAAGLLIWYLKRRPRT